MFSIVREFIGRLRFILKRVALVTRRKIILSGAVLAIVFLAGGAVLARQINDAESSQALTSQTQEQPPVEAISQQDTSPPQDVIAPDQNVSVQNASKNNPEATPKGDGDFSVSVNTLTLLSGATSGEIVVTSTSGEPLMFYFNGQRGKIMQASLSPATFGQSHAFKIAATSNTKAGETYTVSFLSQRKGSPDMLKTKTITVTIVAKTFTVSVDDVTVSGRGQTISLPYRITRQNGHNDSLSFGLGITNRPVEEWFGSDIEGLGSDNGTIFINIPEDAVSGDYIYELSADDTAGYRATDRFVVRLQD